MQRGADYYKFQAFRSDVARADGSYDKLKKSAAFQGVIYVESEYLNEHFNVNGVYLEESDYGVILTQQEMEVANELFEYLMEMGGE